LVARVTDKVGSEGKDVKLHILYNLKHMARFRPFDIPIRHRSSRARQAESLRIIIDSYTNWIRKKHFYLFANFLSCSITRY